MGVAGTGVRAVYAASFRIREVVWRRGRRRYGEGGILGDFWGGMCFVRRGELRIIRSGGNLPPWETRGAVSPGKRGKWRIRRSGGLKAAIWALRVRGCGRFTRRRFVYAKLYGGVDAAATAGTQFWVSGAVTFRIRYALWRQVAAATKERDFGVLAWLQCVYAMPCCGVGAALGFYSVLLIDLCLSKPSG